MVNVRAGTLKKYIADGKLRLSADDRAFLTDLSKVGIIAESDAQKHHFQERKTAAVRRLDRLCEAGVLESHTVNQPGKGTYKAYSFKTERIATLFGGHKPTIGRKRNVLHEVIISRIFFAEGRPDSFVVESKFSKNQRELFTVAGGTMSGRDACFPDAMFVRGGEIVVVEADSGHYNKSQILNKQLAWADYKQVWGQPAKASARVDGGATVHCF